MTVKITKPALNLREELADLRKPSGIAGEAVLRADTTADAREAVELSNVADSATGVDVSGAATMDGLTVDGARSYLRGSNENYTLGIGRGGQTSNFFLGTTASSSPDLIFSNNAGATRANIANNGDISFYDNTGSSAKFHWDAADESLGIGTSLPEGQLTLQNDDALLRIRSNTTTAKGISLKYNHAGNFGQLLVDHQGNNQLAMKYHALTHTFGRSDGLQFMTIDSSGNLLVGHSSFSFGGANDCVQIAGNEGRINFENDTTATAYVAGFYNPNGLVGKISTNGSSTSYATSSDYRLKEDWTPMTGASDRLMQLNPVNFAWKADGSRVDGFLAHEAQEVVPEAVSGTKDAMTTEEYEVSPAVEATYDEDGNELTSAVEAVMGEREVEDYQGIDQSKLVPLLTAALQEALARIEALENK